MVSFFRKHFVSIVFVSVFALLIVTLQTANFSGSGFLRGDVCDPTTNPECIPFSASFSTSMSCPTGIPQCPGLCLNPGDACPSGPTTCCMPDNTLSTTTPTCCSGTCESGFCTSSSGFVGSLPASTSTSTTSTFSSSSSQSDFACCDMAAIAGCVMATTGACSSAFPSGGVSFPGVNSCAAAASSFGSLCLPKHPCCNNGCSMTTWTSCPAGSTYYSSLNDCTTAAATFPSQCGSIGACCNNGCTDGVASSSCIGVPGNTYHNGATCSISALSDPNCVPSAVACCNAGNCSITTAGTCTTGTPHAGLTCAQAAALPDGSCVPETNCSNGTDTATGSGDDGDGLNDCFDPDCSGDQCAPTTPGMNSYCASPAGSGICKKFETNCNDGVDNDGDTKKDCADTSDCSGIGGCPVCPNGIIENPTSIPPNPIGTEQCDDNNFNNFDSCADCKNAVCGDGYKQTAVEACDDGDTDSSDGCSFACNVESGWTCTGSAPSVCTRNCGNGVIDAGESCDNGTANNNNAACTLSCQTNVCGDGHTLTGSEECDNGSSNSNTAACTLLCKNNVCGDGLVETGVEQCDDGDNTNSDPTHDGCEACLISAHYSCIGIGPSTCKPICGDAVITSDDRRVSFREFCDNGKHLANGTPCNSTASDCIPRTDACRNDCKANACSIAQGYPGYAAPPPPSVSCTSQQAFITGLENNCKTQSCGGSACIPISSGRSMKCDGPDADTIPNDGMTPEKYFICVNRYGSSILNRFSNPLCPVHPPTPFPWICNSGLVFCVGTPTAPAPAGFSVAPPGLVLAPAFVLPALPSIIEILTGGSSSTFTASVTLKTVASLLDSLWSFWNTPNQIPSSVIVSPAEKRECEGTAGLCVTGLEQCCNGYWVCPDVTGRLACNALPV